MTLWRFCEEVSYNLVGQEMLDCQLPGSDLIFHIEKPDVDVSSPL